MPLTIYGNNLPLGAPANLHVDVQGLEKLYGLVDANGYGQVASGLLSVAVIDEETSAHEAKDVTAAKKDRAATRSSVRKKV